MGSLLKKRGYPLTFRGRLNITLDSMEPVLNVDYDENGHRAWVGLNPDVVDPLGHLRGTAGSQARGSAAAAQAVQPPPAAAAPAAAAAAAGQPPAAATLPVPTTAPAAAPRPLPWKRVLGVECTIVTTLKAAQEAVAWLKLFEDVAMDTGGGGSQCSLLLLSTCLAASSEVAGCRVRPIVCVSRCICHTCLPHSQDLLHALAEGTLARDGSLDVVQLFADGRAFIFDLHGELNLGGQ